MTTAVSYKERVAQAMRVSALAARLDAVRANGNFAPAIIDTFAEFLDTATDRQLFRMSPLRYASQHGLDESQAINLFLHATHVGILDFNWGIVCSGCGAFLTTASSLRTMHMKRFCNICQEDISAEIDNNIEVAFTVSPTVRKITFHSLLNVNMEENAMDYYFSSSMEMTPVFKQVIKQAMVAPIEIKPGETKTITAMVEPYEYEITVLSHHITSKITVAKGSTQTQGQFELTDTQVVPNKISLAPGTITLTIRNRTAKIAHGALMRDVMKLAVEKFNMTESGVSLLPFLTGKRLVTTQVFRDLFRTESIPSDSGLEFKNLTLLFTDLKGSTEMYRRIGDFRAYKVVRDHFALLKEIVAESDGALVKTIGDAIMASFAEPHQALRAAAAMNHKISNVGGGEDLMLKIGIHSGPCIGVELNDRLDYFGQTVNIAARVQNVANANEIACTGSVYAAPQTRDIIGEANLRVQKEYVPLKGVGEKYEIYRLHSA
jgi:class 3 adenylate cyclase